MKKRLLAFALAAGFLATALARPALKGVDYDTDEITVTSGRSVVITAVVTTTPTGSGNTSSVVLFVNGKEVRRAGGDHANDQLEYRISQPGDYDLKAECGNSRADAKTCTLEVKKQERKVY